MGTRRFATFSSNARAFACIGNRLSSPKVQHFHDQAWSPPRADNFDRSRPLHDDPIALSISARYPVAACLVVGPDDFRDVGAGNERYDALALSGNGVGSEIDGGHYKSSSGPRFRLRARGPEPPQRCRPFVLQGAYTTIRMRVLSEPRKVTPSGNVIQLCPTLANRKRDPVAGECGFAGRPSDRTPGRHVTGLLYRWGLRWGHPRLAVISARRSPTCKPTERIAGRAARIFRRRNRAACTPAVS